MSARRMFGPFGLSLALIIVFTAAPILSVLLSVAIAAIAGCDVNEASTHACAFMGADIGGLLATLFTAGWFVLLTLPLGICAFVVWLVVLLVSRNKAPKEGSAEG